MRKRTLIKALALLLSWLTLSPLLLIMDGRWKLLPKWLRVVLLMLSPMMMVVLLVIGIIAYLGYQDYWNKHHFVTPGVIENITGVKMPRYKVVERNLDVDPFHNWRQRKHRSRFDVWRYDHRDEFMLEFIETPDEAFYLDLRGKGFDYNSGFDQQRGYYEFHLNWGSGLVDDEVVPKGESGNYDYTIRIYEGSRRFFVMVVEL